MKKAIAILTSVLSLFTVYAQNYSVDLIPDSLKQNAHIVIRDCTKELELQTINTGTERIKEIITVLDKDGDQNARLKIFYDKDSRVKILQAILYDKNGKKIKKIKQSEILDFPTYDGFTMYSDNRVKYFKQDFAEYPYTMEYEYEIQHSNLISYSTWYPIQDYNVSVEHSNLKFTHPSGIQFRKKELNIASKSSILSNNDKITEIWECNNYGAIEDEPFDISLSERLPKVLLMPIQLIYDSYKGTLSDWTDYGKWMNNLYSERDMLAENEKLKLSELLKDTSDTIQKIKVIYEYMQGRTRYVGIQLGIGGFQPFSAVTVFETGYGDCKALTNYMHSLLKQIGIKSFPALVSSGKYIEPLYKDFPNFSQFDHVILCVPLKKDTLWLECTSQTMPMGFIGDFTDDRDVLLLTDEGGKFAHTKKYEAEDNLKTCKALFIIDSVGNANCTSQTKYAGLQYDDIIGFLNLNFDEQKKWLYNNSSLPSLQLNKFTLINEKKELPIAKIDEELSSNNYCSITREYMILPLNKINFQRPIQKMLKERHSEILINRSSVDYDTLIYKIPANYKIEFIPIEKTLKSPFGEYSCLLNFKDGQLIYTRRFALRQGRFKATEYKNFYEFFLSVSKADNEKVMLQKISN